MPASSGGKKSGASRWSLTELQRLQQALEEQRDGSHIDWSRVARRVGTRSRKQVYRRWRRETKRLGERKELLAGGRERAPSDNSSSVKPRRHWSAAERVRLAEACQQFRDKDGLVDLRQVASYVGTRSLRQIRDHLRYRQGQYLGILTESATQTTCAVQSSSSSYATSPSNSSEVPLATSCDWKEWDALRRAYLWTSARPSNPSSDSPGPLLSTLNDHGLSLALLLETFYALGLDIAPSKAGDRAYMHQLLYSDSGLLEKSIQRWSVLEQLHRYLWQYSYTAAGMWVAFCFGSLPAFAGEQDESAWLQGYFGEAGMVHKVRSASRQTTSSAIPSPQSWPSIQSFVAHGLVCWYTGLPLKTEAPSLELLSFVVPRLRLDGLALPSSLFMDFGEQSHQKHREHPRQQRLPRKRTVYGAPIYLLVQRGILPPEGEHILAYRGIYGSIAGNSIYGALLGQGRGIRLGASLNAFIQRASQWSDVLGLGGAAMLTLYGCPLANAALPAERLSEWNPVLGDAPTLPSGCMLRLAKTALETADVPDGSPTATVCLAVLLEEIIKIQRDFQEHS